MAKSNPFSKEINFEYGVALPLSPFVRRLVADNAGPLTFKGTNVYIIGRGEVAIVDPGPDDDRHIDTLLQALPGERITHIILTHTHKDHCGGLSKLKQATGAKTYAYSAQGAVRGAYRSNEGQELASEFADTSFVPDIALNDGDQIQGLAWALTAVHTPGHAPDHVCYALPQEKALITGDHIMPWSTSVIAPPEGNMGIYMRSLEGLLARDDELYLPGHGGRVYNPKQLARAYILHRQWREKSVLEACSEGHGRVEEIVSLLYEDVEQDIKAAAALSVLAHLEYLSEKGKLRQRGGNGLSSTFEVIAA